jgi:dUTP pyrophosphatase
MKDMLDKKVVTKVKKIHPDAKLPVYATGEESGADLFTVEEVTVPAGGRVLVHTGIVLELPQGHEAQVRSKSGLALKAGIQVLNSPGTVDEGYRGEIGVILYNTGEFDYVFEKGQKVAQLVVKPVYQSEFIEAEELSETERAEGGFGHNGK